MQSNRYESIDQFRGFAVLGMVLVNVLGRYSVIPQFFKHQYGTGFSFADAVAPFFMFVVGMAFRVAYIRNVERSGVLMTWLTVMRRFFTLFVVGAFVYQFNPDRIFWGALSEISVAGLLALPAIGLNKKYRIGAAVFYPILFLALPDWQPFGKAFEPFLWVSILLLGSLLADFIQKDDKRGLLWCCLGWGFAFVLIGGVLSYASLNISHFIFYVGLSFLLYAVFYIVADVCHKPFPHLSVLGKNALVVYALHYVVDNDLQKLIAGDASLWLAFSSFGVVYFACYAVAVYLDKRKYYITV